MLRFVWLPLNCFVLLILIPTKVYDALLPSDLTHTRGKYMPSILDELHGTVVLDKS